MESFIREIQRFGELFEGFSGHNVAERSELRSFYSMAARRGKDERDILHARYTDEECETLLDRLLAKRNDQPHDGIKGRTPNQVLHQLTTGREVRRITDPLALSALIAPGGTRKVTKKGIAVGARRFIAPELGAFVGREVEHKLHWDPDRIFVFTREPREFLCIARATAAMSNEEQRGIALDARGIWRTIKNEVRARSRALVKQLPAPAVEIMAAGGTDTGSVEPATVQYSTPALEVAADAVAAAQSEEESLQHVDHSPREASYDEEEESRKAVARYLRLLDTERSQWTDEDRDFIDLAGALPEIKEALLLRARRRASA